MRRHPKASTAGSSTGQKSHLGRIAAVIALALLAFCGIGASTALADNLPTITTDPASGEGPTVAKLSGTVNPHGEAGSGNTSWRIDYRKQGETEWSPNPANAGTIEAPASEEANPVGVEAIFGYGGELQPGETYEYRIVAENGAGSAETPSPYPTFTMKTLNVPTLATGTTTAAGYTIAKLHGTVDPEGGNVEPLNGGLLPIYWNFEVREVGKPDWSNVGGGEISNQPVEIEPGVFGPAPAESTAAIPVDLELGPGSLKAGKTYEVRVFAYYLNFSRTATSPEAELEADRFTTKAIGLPSVSGFAVSDVTDHSAHLVGAVNPNAAEEPPLKDADTEAAYRVDWHFECTPGCPAPGGQIEGDQKLHSLEGDTSLDPHVKYAIKLVATNAQGTVETAAQEVESGAIKPTVGTSVNTPIGPGAMTVRGYVNPHNSEITDCHFAYGLTTAYGQSTPCTPSPGSGNGPVLIVTTLGGLDEGATYHFKLVATSAAGSDETEDGTFEVPSASEEPSCPNEARRKEQGETGLALPDCRAYEMVSPADKNGGDITVKSTRTRVADDGNAVNFTSPTPFGDAIGNGVSADYMSLRSGNPEPGSNGWATHAISPRQASLTPRGVAGSGGEQAYLGEFSADLNRGVYRAWSPVTDDPYVEDGRNLYLRDDLRSAGSGHYQLLTMCPLCEVGGERPLIEEERFPYYAGGSSDLTHLLFEYGVNLTEDTPAQEDETCIKKIDPRYCRRHVYEWDEGTLRLAGLIPPGSQISCGPGGPACIPAGASVAGRSERSSTVAQNAISQDGSRIFFTAPTDGSGTITYPTYTVSYTGKIYLRANHETTVQLNASERTDCAGDVTCGGDNEPDPAPDSYQPAQFWGASADGSRSFFITGQQLTDDPSGGIYMYDADKPSADPHNLTLLHSGGNYVIGASDDGSYVYFVAQGQIFVWHQGKESSIGTADVSFAELLATTVRETQARVSPDGRFLLFGSRSGNNFSTGYNHDTVQIYLYSAVTRELVCVSCRPDGSATNNEAAVVSTARAVVTQGGEHRTNAVSDDGRYVFFTSAEPLVATDTNGERDAYVYDKKTSSVHMLSSGTDPFDSYFVDASPNGKDAFIVTREQLVAWDVDQNFDLYDVRVDGGFPEPRPVPAQCSGDSCQGADEERGAQLSPARLAAPGNPVVQRQKKRHSRHKRRHSKSTKKQHKRAASESRRAGR